MNSSSSIGVQPSPLPSSDHDLYLDWLRGIAALLVFITHVRGGFFVKWSDLDPASQTHLNFFLFFLTRLGREAVIIFFVLSGYLVGGQAVIEYRAGRYSFRHYIIARIARLYTVVVPALLLTGLFDYLHGVWSNESHGLQSLVINFFFLQNIFGASYGSNAPLWSLSYEWWFYVLFGLGLAALARASLRATALLALLICAITTTLWLMSPSILLVFPLWLVGVVVRIAPGSAFPKGRTAILALAVLCVALGVSNIRGDWQGDYLIGISTAALIYFVRGLAPPAYPWIPFGKTLAAFSFSLYALHYPLNYLVQSVLNPQRLNSAGLVNWLRWLGIVIGMAAFCYLLYWIFERRTPAVRRWLHRALTPRPQSIERAPNES